MTTTATTDPTLYYVSLTDYYGDRFAAVLTADELAAARDDEFDIVLRVRPAVFGPHYSEVEREIMCRCGRRTYSSLAMRDHCLECEWEPYGPGWQREQRDRY